MQSDKTTQNQGLGQPGRGQGGQQQSEQPQAFQQGSSSFQSREVQGRQGGASSEVSRRGSGQGQHVPMGNIGGGTMRQHGWTGPQRYNRDPFSVVQQLSEEMDQLFDAFFYGSPGGARGRRSNLQTLWAPEIEVRERGNELRICVDLPGVAKENVKVDIEDGALIIQGERSEAQDEGGEGQGFRRSERRYGSFYRSIALPEGADLERAQANMKDGVLEIVLPMPQPRQAQRLEIKG